jgi:hypothetical protein
MNPKNRNALAERVVKAAEAALAAQGYASAIDVPERRLPPNSGLPASPAASRSWASLGLQPPCSRRISRLFPDGPLPSSSG